MHRTLRSIVLGLLASVVACDNPLPGDEICRDIGYAISNKSFECSGDVDASNQAYEDFASAHSCKISDLPSEDQLANDHIRDPPQDSVGDPYQCSASILKLSCDQVAALGTDYDRWMATANRTECGVVYDAASGGPLPEAGGVGGAGGAGGMAGGGAGLGGGAGGDPGAAGAGGAVPSLITLHASGAIGASPIDADCTQRSSPDLIFTCEGPGGVSTEITLRSITGGGLADYASIDAAFHFQFDAPGVATTLSPGDTFAQLSATTTIISPPVSGLVSLNLYIAIQRQSSPPLSLVIQGNADHVPCGSACGH